MTEQLSFIINEKKTRQPRRIMMHRVDMIKNSMLYDLPLQESFKVKMRFQCAKCDKLLEINEYFTETEIKRGIPCPKCN